MSKATKILIFILVLAASGLTVLIYFQPPELSTPLFESFSIENNTEQDTITQEDSLPMFIEALRQRDYPGGDFTIEEKLTDQSKYQQYIASYLSQGFKIYGLLTIPTTKKPVNGYPAIIFVHGHIPPQQYLTTKNYASYQAILAKNEFVTFKPDLRGHGQSEGEATSAHFSETYVVDVLSAIAYLKEHQDVNKNRIGYWGHSNGGETGLRAVVVSTDIKASVFWAGVVGSFEDMLETYNDQIPFLKNRENPLVEEYGLPSDNPQFWQKLDPYAYLADIVGPIQLHHGSADTSVPIELSIRLKEELEKNNKQVELYQYPDDNHNITNNFSTAWQRTVDFFKQEL